LLFNYGLIAIKFGREFLIYSEMNLGGRMTCNRNQPSCGLYSLWLLIAIYGIGASDTWPVNFVRTAPTVYHFTSWSPCHH